MQLGATFLFRTLTAHFERALYTKCSQLNAGDTPTAMPPPPPVPQSNKRPRHIPMGNDNNENDDVTPNTTEAHHDPATMNTAMDTSDEQSRQ